MSLKDKLPEIVDPGVITRSFQARESWRVFEIMAEFVESTERLQQIQPAISLFGSARTARDHPYYKLTEQIARRLSDCGFSVISGGGPGIMEAANRGAHDEGAPNIGLNITLPHEQSGNRFITPTLSYKFHYFALRKMHFLMRSVALVCFPGGFGTLDELFEALTLIQTGKCRRRPILMFGRDFWSRLINFELLIETGMIGADDVRLFQFVETAEEAWAYLSDHYGFDLPDTETGAFAEDI